MTPTLYLNKQRRFCLAVHMDDAEVHYVQLVGSEVALYKVPRAEFDGAFFLDTSNTKPIHSIAANMLELPAKAGITLTATARRALESIAKGGDTMTELPFATATITKAPKGLEEKVGQQVDPTSVKKPRKPRSDAGKPRTPKAEKVAATSEVAAPKTRKPRTPKAPVDGAAEIVKIREAADKKIAAIEAKIAAVEAKLKARAEKEADEKVKAAEKRLAALEALLAK